MHSAAAAQLNQSASPSMSTRHTELKHVAPLTKPATRRATIELSLSRVWQPGHQHPRRRASASVQTAAEFRSHERHSLRHPAIRGAANPAGTRLKGVHPGAAERKVCLYAKACCIALTTHAGNAALSKPEGGVSGGQRAASTCPTPASRVQLYLALALVQN